MVIEVMNMHQCRVIFLGILAVLIGLAVVCITKRGEAALAILGGIIVIAVSFVTSVPTGYTGIITTFGKIEEYTLDAGSNFKSPWQDVILIDNREQRMSFSVQAFSADIQQVDLSGPINYSVDKGKGSHCPCGHRCTADGGHEERRTERH